MKPEIRTATFDTNVFPARALVERAASVGIRVAVVSVSARELSRSGLASELDGLESISEVAVVDESHLDEAVVGSDSDERNYELALRILSNNAFPGHGERDELASGEHRQLRDAMILCAHVASGRDVLVSNDQKAFIRNGRKDAIKATFGTNVMTALEFEAFVAMREADRRLSGD